MSNQVPGQSNLAFIDGQNLYMGTAKLQNGAWRVDLARFRTYLREKYRVEKALYFLGYADVQHQDLYEMVRRAGFETRFKPHGMHLESRKKGNVDTDIIFDVMKRLYEKEDVGKIVLVSGDGDYKTMVDFLMKEGYLGKVLAPCRTNASSLYKRMHRSLFGSLDDSEVRKKIETSRFIK